MDKMTTRVPDAQAAMARLKELAVTLKEERAAAVRQIADIDELLSDLGQIGKPKPGRPRGSRNKKEVPTQPAGTA